MNAVKLQNAVILYIMKKLTGEEPHRLQQTTSIPGFRLVSSNRGFSVKGENGVDRVHRFVFVEKNVPSENGPFCVGQKIKSRLEINSTTTLRGPGCFYVAM